MNAILLTWDTYLLDPLYWHNISETKSIPLHIGEDPEETA